MLFRKSILVETANIRSPKYILLKNSNNLIECLFYLLNAKILLKDHFSHFKYEKAPSLSRDRRSLPRSRLHSFSSDSQKGKTIDNHGLRFKNFKYLGNDEGRQESRSEGKVATTAMTHSTGYDERSRTIRIANNGICWTIISPEVCLPNGIAPLATKFLTDVQFGPDLLCEDDHATRHSATQHNATQRNVTRRDRDHVNATCAPNGIESARARKQRFSLTGPAWCCRCSEACSLGRRGRARADQVAFKLLVATLHRAWRITTDVRRAAGAGAGAHLSPSPSRSRRAAGCRHRRPATGAATVQCRAMTHATLVLSASRRIPTACLYRVFVR